MNIEADLKRFFNFQIGEISKKWTGLGEEMFTDADNFGVSFPKDLDIKVLFISPKQPVSWNIIGCHIFLSLIFLKVKLSLLAATFLIDFMYFEESPESIDWLIEPFLACQDFSDVVRPCWEMAHLFVNLLPNCDFDIL